MFCLEKLGKNKVGIKYDVLDEWFKVGARFYLFTSIWLDYEHSHPGMELHHS